MMRTPGWRPSDRRVIVAAGSGLGHVSGVVVTVTLRVAGIVSEVGDKLSIAANNVGRGLRDDIPHQERRSSA